MLKSFLITSLLAILGIILYDREHPLRKFSYLLTIPFIFLIVLPSIWIFLGILLIALLIYGIIFIVEKTFEKGGRS